MVSVPSEIVVYFASNVNFRSMLSQSSGHFAVELDVGGASRDMHRQ